MPRSVMSQSCRVWLAVPVIIGALSSISTPLRSPELTGRPETSATMRLRILAASQELFASSCGNGGYAVTLNQLATPPPGSTDAFLPAPATESHWHGYVFQLIPAGVAGPRDCHGRPTSRSFSATAVPIVFGESGRRSFTVVPDGTIWYSETSVAPTEPFERSGNRIN